MDFSSHEGNQSVVKLLLSLEFGFHRILWSARISYIFCHFPYDQLQMSE